jgi:hemolysin III
MSRPALLWLLGGGIFYTVGVIFFAAKKMKYSHAVWHVFVVGGSVSHFVAVYVYLLPA